jgi:hypothetical protein
MKNCNWPLYTINPIVSVMIGMIICVCGSCFIRNTSDEIVEKPTSRSVRLLTTSKDNPQPSTARTMVSTPTKEDHEDENDDEKKKDNNEKYVRDDEKKDEITADADDRV